MINLLFLDNDHRDVFENIHAQNLNRLNFLNYYELTELDNDTPYCIFIDVSKFFIMGDEKYAWIDPNKAVKETKIYYNLPDRVLRDSKLGLVHWIISWSDEADITERISFEKLAHGLNTTVENITFLTASEIDESTKHNLKIQTGVTIIKYSTLFQWTGFDVRKDEVRKQLTNHILSVTQSIINKTDKNFKGLMYNRMKRRHRILFLALLKHHNYLNSTIYSCGNSTQSIDELIDRFPYLKSDLEYFEQLTNKSADSVDLNRTHAKSVNFEHSADSYLHIVSESLTTRRTYITEKSYKPFIMMQPFVMLGNKGNVQFLRNRGYNTFDKWIDHAYDTIDDDYDRTYAAFKEIERLYNLTNEDWNDMLVDMLPALIDNANIFLTPETYNIGELISILLQHQEKKNGNYL